MADSEMRSASEALGELRSEHARNRGRNWMLIVLLAVGGLMGLLAGPLLRRQGSNGGVCVSGFGLGMLVLAGWSLYVARRDRDLRVRVYDNGLVVTRAGDDRVIRWDAVASVNHVAMQSLRVRRGPTHLCTLKTRDGAATQFSDATLQNVAGLCERIQAGTLDPLLRRVAARLQAGERVTFGPLAVTSQGVDLGRGIVPWVRVGAIREADGQIALRIDGAWRKVGAAGRVDNVHVLSALVAKAGADG